jgi:hypothetical protein
MLWSFGSNLLLLSQCYYTPEENKDVVHCIHGMDEEFICSFICRTIGNSNSVTTNFSTTTELQMARSSSTSVEKPRAMGLAITT